ARQLGRRRTVRARQRHVDVDHAVVIDDDFVNQTELVEIGGSFLGGGGGERGHRFGFAGGRLPGGGGAAAVPGPPPGRRAPRAAGSSWGSAFRPSCFRFVHHVKNSSAFRSACARISISAEPFWPMTVSTSPAFTARPTPFNIFLPSISTCRFSISSNSIPCPASLGPIQIVRAHPTEPSSETEINFCASTANSIGSCCSTSLTKPLITSATASSADSPR